MHFQHVARHASQVLLQDSPRHVNAGRQCDPRQADPMRPVHREAAESGLPASAGAFQRIHLIEIVLVINQRHTIPDTPQQSDRQYQPVKTEHGADAASMRCSDTGRPPPRAANIERLFRFVQNPAMPRKRK
ncbi:MAG: hypothetical protein EBX44_05825 [Betaproteobacteria bacterium]|nr:hypothetical protein [Betaproteobacteria bacterium]